MAVEYRDDTPFTGDNHTPTELANAIRTKKDGKDVREPIAQAVEKLSNAVLGGNIGNVVATPTKVFDNLSKLQEAYPAGADGVMVTVDNGHKYFWSNGQWTDGGVYQSDGLSDQSIEATKLSGSAKTLKFYFKSNGIPEMDVENSVIKIPAGAVQGIDNTSAETFEAQELIIENDISWIAFNTTTKLFELSDNPGKSEVVVGNYNKNLNQFIIYNAPTPKGMIGNSQLHAATRKIKFFFDGEGFVKFDLVNKKLIIPSGSYQTNEINTNNTFEAQELTLTPGIDWISFNYKTKKFEVGGATPTRTVVGAYNTNVANECIFYDGLYAVNGVIPSATGSIGTLYTTGKIKVDTLNKKLILSGKFQANVGEQIYSFTQNESLNISGSNFILLDLTARKITIGAPVNSGDVFVRIGYFLYDGLYLHLPSANVRYDSSLLLIGNSILAGVNSSYSVAKYIEYGLTRAGVDVTVTNNSVGSTAVSNGKWLTDQSYINRIADLDGKFGSVVIHLGENEFNGSREIGDVTSTDTNTMCGGLNSLISMLREKNTNGQIFISTPAYAHYGGHDWRTKINDVNKKIDDYIEAFAEVARLRNCIWIDNRNISFVPTEVPNQTVDGLHPNAVASRMFAGNILRTVLPFVLTDFDITDDPAHHSGNVIS